MIDDDAFKNYEPYHNGNSRSSRKVPKSQKNMKNDDGFYINLK